MQVMENDASTGLTQRIGKSVAGSDTERIVLEIWMEVLQVSSIGIEDEFLSVGDSLAALRCINRIISIFGVELPLDLFLLRSANVVQIAQEIEKARCEISSDVH
jgi:acyl carrier protein